MMSDAMAATSIAKLGCGNLPSIARVGCGNLHMPPKVFTPFALVTTFAMPPANVITAPQAPPSPSIWMEDPAEMCLFSLLKTAASAPVSLSGQGVRLVPSLMWEV